MCDPQRLCMTANPRLHRVPARTHYGGAGCNRLAGTHGKGSAMSDVVNLISRVLLSAVFIVYGYAKLVDVMSIVNNPGTKRFMDTVAGGMPAPTWLGYLIAAIEFFG